MRTLSATLLAAQKKPDRLPYVEAKVYDYEAGIKRLTWTRLYEGTEPDNHHGIAFDGQGSMHRIRVDTGYEYKKLIGQNDQTIAASVAADYHWTDKFTAIASGQMDLFRIKCSGSGNVKVAIYADADGSPGALLNAVNTGQAVVAGWNEIPFPPTQITQGTSYWLSFISDAQIVGRWNQAGNAKKCKSVAYSGFTFPDPAGSFDYNYTDVPDLTAGWQAASSGSLLFHQKVESPDEASDYSQWTEIASDCDGPCAIAAYGARVYIFYKTSTNVLWKYYSHDYGQTWDDAQLASYADVLSLAACWWATGDIVVCFALKSNQLNGITLDTSTQEATQHTWSDANHPLLETYGIGATYNPFWPAIEIVFAGKESDSPYNHYDLFRTKFSNTYNFLALESFLMSPDGEDITYEYPDCHLPANAELYEPNRIVAVEKFAGTTAYTRPLACHTVKGTHWSDTTFTEPKPFLDISSAYGLRLQSTAGYWWMERPDGVWRAPRAAAEPLTLTTDAPSGRILSLSLNQSPSHLQSSLTLTLNNSKGQYASPGEGALASLRFRSEIVLELGYKTTAGKETSEAGTYWVDGWEYSTNLNQSLFRLYCIDGWGLMDRWTARYQMRWNKDEVNPKSVWQILYQLLARAGIKLTNTPPKPQSSAVNNFYPDFTVNPGTRGDSAIRKLLSFVPDRLVFRGQEAFTKNPLSDEESCYSYGTDHVILTGQYRQAVTLSRSRALGRDDSDNRILEEALDWDLLQLAIDILEQDYDPNLQTAARAQERADAILRTRAQEAEPAVITVGTNVGQELLDVVEVTDVRCGIDQEKYRVHAIRTDYDRRKGIYTQCLALCAP